jgi:hypothetical protein
MPSDINKVRLTGQGVRGGLERAYPVETKAAKGFDVFTLCYRLPPTEAAIHGYPDGSVRVMVPDGCARDMILPGAWITVVGRQGRAGNWSVIVAEEIAAGE